MQYLFLRLTSVPSMEIIQIKILEQLDLKSSFRKTT